MAEEDLTARCKIAERDLIWYDFWVASEGSFILFLKNEGIWG